MQKHILLTIAITIMASCLYAQFPGGDGTEQNPYWVGTAVHLDSVRHHLDSYFIQIDDIDLSGYNWEPIGEWVDYDHPNNRPLFGGYDGDNYTINNLFIDRSSNIQALFAFFDGAIVKNVNLINVDVSGVQTVGGLIAIAMNSEINNCFSSGEVTASSWYAGGLVGVLAGSNLTSSYSEANVHGVGHVGGIVGRAYAQSQIHDCYAIGDITGEVGQDGLAVGGIVGSMATSTILKSYSGGSVDGYLDVGGLVGAATSRSSIQKSYTFGSVSGTENCGGMIGVSYDSDIISSYSNSGVEGDLNIGGFAGYVGLSPTPVAPANIIDSYSTGQVNGNTNVGGFLGVSNQADITNSYWDIESSGQSTSAGGEGKLTVEMVQHDTFDNWDFQNTWEIQKHNPYILKTYPHLQWQGYAGLHNRLDNSLVKLFEDRNWHWDSFPRLERDQYGFQPAPEVLEPLEGTIDHVLAKPNQAFIIEMYWHLGAWQGDNIEFNSPDGYKLRTIDEEPYYLHVTGDRIDLSTPITLQPNTVNWIGYFIPSSQCPFDAFSEDTLERLEAIRAQDWSMRKDSQGNWVYAANPRPSMEYGKMYEIETSINEPLTFTWNIPPGYPDYLEPSEFTLADNSEYFDYTDSYDYESYFVEDIEEDEGLLEVGVLVDDQCVGATVFNESYPLELQAYTHEGHSGGNLSFELYYGRNRSTQRYRVVEVKDPQTGAYTAQTLRPRRQKFALVRIGSQQGMQTPQEPVVMEISNHPNPFNPDTTINFTVSSEQNVELIVYNIKGQKVTTLYDGSAAEGKHSVVWNGTDDRGNAVSSGMYFYRLKADNTELSGKMLLLK